MNVIDLIAKKAIQLSRKYRTVAVPPELPQGSATTYLDMLRERHPRTWARFEEQAREYVARFDSSYHVELTWEEFNEWLKAKGCKPLTPEHTT